MCMNTLISIKKCETHNKLTSVGIGTENIDFLFFIISKIFICFYEIKNITKQWVRQQKIGQSALPHKRKTKNDNKMINSQHQSSRKCTLKYP